MLSLSRNSATRLLAPICRAKPFQTASRSMVKISSGDELLEVGPYPKTKEERIRAAKKYNLIPEDYEPYPEDEAWGDYPKLKAIGAFNRDSYDDYDDPFERRYYGEPRHRDDDLYKWERIDPLAHEKPNLPTWMKFVVFVGVAASVPTISYFFNKFNLNINHPWKQRTYCPEQQYYAFPPS